MPRLVFGRADGNETPTTSIRQRLQELRKLPNKNTVEEQVFINYKGKRTSRQIGTLRAANKVKEQIEARLKLGHDALPKEKPGVPTLEEYWEDTFKKNYVDSALRKSTAASYASNFKTDITPALGALPLDEVLPGDIEAFIAKLVIEKKKAKATIATIMKELCKLFNHARKHKMLRIILPPESANCIGKPKPFMKRYSL